MITPLVMDLGKHAVFIWSSYGLVLVVVCGLIGWLVLEGRRLQHRIARFEERGAGRRSSPQTPGEGAGR